jgi:HD-GYP domain-containing protein (c-di-GMP phosphodiesterase class II)
VRSVPVDELNTGDRLGRDIYGSSDALPLLRAGARMSDSYRHSLTRAGITSVWIDDGISEGIDPLEGLEEATKRRAMTVIRDGFREAAASLKSGGTLSGDTVEDLRDVSELIVRDVARNAHSALALYDLSNADGYTLKHSLAVTTLGVSLGLRVMQKYGWVDALGKRRFDGIQDRLGALGLGLLLHDIGKLAVPAEILRKPGALTEDEQRAVRAHPTLGLQIVRTRDQVNPLARVVIRSHHERWNGTGYPDGQSGSEIHPFAQIAAVADVFDALTSDRYYRKAARMDEACDFIASRSGHDFDPEVVDVFRWFVAPYPPATRVVLSDGHCALVKEVRPGAVRTPIVRIITDRTGALLTPRDIDLSKSPGLTIVSTEFALPTAERV